MITPLRRAKAASGPSAERAALAEAVAEYQAASERERALRAAHQGADDAVHAARLAVEATAAGIEVARKAAVDHAVALASGETPTPPVTIRQAKTASDDAADELASALAARDQLARELDRAGGGFGLRDSALSVLKIEARDAAAALAAQVEALQRSLAAKGAELRSLCELGVFPKAEFGGLVDQAVSVIVNRLHTPPDLWPDMGAEASAGSAKWPSAIAALMGDADAPLPS